MRYFITGATGFIGSRIALKLLESGQEVIALVRDPGKAGMLVERGAAVVKGDITVRESMRCGMTGADGVFHVAAWYRIGFREKERAYHVNVEGTRNVLELMRELHIPRGVYTSTLAVFSDTRGKMVDESCLFTGKHLSLYDMTKWLAHYEVAKPMISRGLPLIIVMPGLVYGPGDNSPMNKALHDLVRGKLPFLPRRTSVCWGYIDDVADAHIKAMQHGKPGSCYITAGPPHTLEEALDMASELTDIRAPRLRISPVLIKCAALKMWFWEKLIPVPQRYRSESLRVIAGTTYLGDSSRAVTELGCHFRPLGDGLSLTLKNILKEEGIECKL